MRRRKRIGIDCDGVLAAFLPQAQRIYRSMFGYDMPEFYEWDFASVIPNGRVADFWDAVARDRVHWKLDPYDGACEAFTALQSVADVYVVTSPLLADPHWEYDRRFFLRECFGVPSNRVQFQHDKHTFAGDMLIDDKPENVAAWAEEHEAGTAILWSHPYNERHDFRRLGYRIVRTNDWATVLRLAGG